MRFTSIYTTIIYAVHIYDPGDITIQSIILVGIDSDISLVVFGEHSVSLLRERENCEREGRRDLDILMLKLKPGAVRCLQ